MFCGEGQRSYTDCCSFVDTWSEGNFLDAFVAVIKPYKAKKENQ
jgi:hypothetical protein